MYGKNDSPDNVACSLQMAAPSSSGDNNPSDVTSGDLTVDQLAQAYVDEWMPEVTLTAPMLPDTTGSSPRSINSSGDAQSDTAHYEASEVPRNDTLIDLTRPQGTCQRCQFRPAAGFCTNCFQFICQHPQCATFLVTTPRPVNIYRTCTCHPGRPPWWTLDSSGPRLTGPAHEGVNAYVIGECSRCWQSLEGGYNEPLANQWAHGANARAFQRYRAIAMRLMRWMATLTGLTREMLAAAEVMDADSDRETMLDDASDQESHLQPAQPGATRGDDQEEVPH